MESTNRKLEKKPLFSPYCGYETTICYDKAILFSLKFQRSNRQNALAMYPAKGKTGEKGCMSIALWR